MYHIIMKLFFKVSYTNKKILSKIILLDWYSSKDIDTEYLINK